MILEIWWVSSDDVMNQFWWFRMGEYKGGGISWYAENDEW